MKLHGTVAFVIKTGLLVVADCKEEDAEKVQEEVFAQQDKSVSNETHTIDVSQGDQLASFG